jgi:uncharacterized protein YdeI (YjbR/CyaY-like superfamily)
MSRKNGHLKDAEVVHFVSPAAVRQWLSRNHATATELFIGFYKKSSGKAGASYSEALDQALCYGWIDGVRYSLGSESYMIRFTPRKAKSIWSLVNVRRVQALQKAGKMAEPGISAFAAREKHRTGIYAFEQKRPGLSAKHKRVLRANRRAWEFFSKQAPWYQRTAGYWVSSAKQEETRSRRLAQLTKDSENGRRLAQLSREPSKQTAKNRP